MSSIRDADGRERGTLFALADFQGRRVLEVGSGDGRMTWGYVGLAASVLAIDPDAERIEAARAATPPELAERVRFEVASAAELELPPASFDIAVLPWSL